MKFEALRRSLVRWLNPAATSVPPKIPPAATIHLDRRELPPELVKLLDGMLDDAVKTGTGVIRTRIEPDQLYGPDMELTGPTMPWSSWHGAMVKTVLPGWAFVAFACRHTNDGMAMVQGIARDQFGIWNSMMNVCHEANDGDHALEPVLLCSVCHLRTGMAMGIFRDPKVAAEACEIAMQIGDWRIDIDPEGPPHLPFAALISKAKNAWEGMGIVREPDHHAHAPGAGDRPLVIWSRNVEAMTTTKDRLS